MNLYLILYGLIALAAWLIGVSKLYGMGMTLGAALYGVGTGFLLVTYGLRWFGSDKSILSNAKVQWPPVMNTCPDFLTYYQRVKADGSKEDTCIDTLGVSRNPAALKRWPTDQSVPTEDTFYFSLTTIKTDAAGKNQELCQRAILNGLTWEGITNGESCILPDGSKTAPPSQAPAGCPTA